MPADPSALSWQPGPPPLDKPGRYDCRFPEWRVAVTVRSVDGVPPYRVYDDDDNRLDATYVDSVRSHFGPIHDPPALNEETTDAT